MQAEIGNPEKVNSVDSLYEAHIRYLNKALFRCILNKKARPVHKIIIDIFNIVAKFSIVLTSRWARSRIEASSPDALYLLYVTVAVV